MPHSFKGYGSEPRPRVVTPPDTMTGLLFHVATARESTRAFAANGRQARRAGWRSSNNSNMVSWPTAASGVPSSSTVTTFVGQYKVPSWAVRSQCPVISPVTCPECPHRPFLPDPDDNRFAPAQGDGERADGDRFSRGRY